MHGRRLHQYETVRTLWCVGRQLQADCCALGQADDVRALDLHRSQQRAAVGGVTRD
jgi:hypothetical protein